MCLKPFYQLDMAFLVRIISVHYNALSLLCLSCLLDKVTAVMYPAYQQHRNLRNSCKPQSMDPALLEAHLTFTNDGVRSGIN
jgi:hypothetical protein